MRILLMTTSAILLSFAVPAQAQSRKDLAAQTTAIDTRLTRLEQRMLTGDPAAERLMQRIDALETAQRALRGELETVRFERDNYKGEVEALAADIREMQDLSNRMKIHLDAVDIVAKETQAARTQTLNQGLSTQGFSAQGQSSQGQPFQGQTSNPSSIPAAPEFRQESFNIIPSPAPEASGTLEANAAPAPAEPLPSNDLSELGNVGKTKLAEGDFLGAQTALSQYLQFNPDAADAGEMQYWLGESYFVRGGYADAADAYIASMRKDPQGIKGPEAMVRLGASLRELGQVPAACQTLASFSTQYPNAPVTVKEKAQLEAARTGC